MSIQIRSYELADARDTLDIFRTAILIGAAKDYTPKQLSAWAGTLNDYPDWHTMRRTTRTAVAVLDGEVVGFTDISLASPGYINMMFVDPTHQRIGVGSAPAVYLIWFSRGQGMRTGGARCATDQL